MVVEVGPVGIRAVEKTLMGVVIEITSERRETTGETVGSASCTGKTLGCTEQTAMASAVLVLAVRTRTVAKSTAVNQEITRCATAAIGLCRSKTSRAVSGAWLAGEVGNESVVACWTCDYTGGVVEEVSNSIQTLTTVADC